MPKYVFPESFKSPKRIEIIFNCLRNVDRQTKDIYILTHSAQDHQILKAKRS